ncbi:deoxyribose-phosphate aldolase [Cyanobacterium aponinum]|uniref:deoxyribose-phosphate aldolase n=1 Tax=Cyanobacterium aponinum TaxID=379064 RepID=UPI000C12D68D|nr:deoxyribose-phosphate aldolase [Cyanobacterium aponinum]PHV62715.1 deoxyribose-phosphate aldolase [Cyanobacterium aponinum IPPAS B-1201]
MRSNFISATDIDIADYIDFALLQPTATRKDVENACKVAIQYNFASVCVYPSAVKVAAELLHNQKSKVCTVIGFPSGASTTNCKVFEAQEAVENGVQELDVVINLGWLREGNSELIYKEMASIVEETRQVIKAILETSVLTPTEKRLAAEICMDAGVSFLKTSTGWFGGATVEDVKFLQEITKGRIEIKASGGIKTLENAIALINAGATRLGTSKGVELVRQQKNQEG